MQTEDIKVSIPVGDIIVYTHFEAIPWYLMRIGSSNVKELRPSAHHFTSLHSSHQGISARAEYIQKHPVEGLSYLLLFSSVSRIFHGNNKRVYEDVIDHLGYCPVEGNWIEAEVFIESELLTRLTPDDIARVSLKSYKPKK